MDNRNNEEMNPEMTADADRYRVVLCDAARGRRPSL